MPAATIDRRTERVSQVVYLDPSEIQADQTHNPRRYPAAHIDDMIKSLLTRGQEVPVKVLATPDDKFLLRWGGRRWQAALAINEQQLYDPVIWPHGFRLACVVVTDIPPAKNKTARAERDRLDMVAAISENVDRVDMSVPDRAYAMSRLKDEFGMAQNAIADVFQCSESLVSRYLKLASLSRYGLLGESIQRLMQEDKLSWRLVLDALECGNQAAIEKALGVVESAVLNGAPMSADILRAALRTDDTLEPEAEVDEGPYVEPTTATIEDTYDTDTAAAPVPRSKKAASAPVPAPVAEAHIKARTTKEVLTDIQDYLDKWDAANEGGEKPGSVLFANHLARYIRGTVGWRYIVNRLKEAYTEE